MDIVSSDTGIILIEDLSKLSEPHYLIVLFALKKVLVICSKNASNVIYLCVDLHQMCSKTCIHKYERTVIVLFTF
jgi:hypothetical protein